MKVFQSKVWLSVIGVLASLITMITPVSASNGFPDPYANLDFVIATVKADGTILYRSGAEGATVYCWVSMGCDHIEMQIGATPNTGLTYPFAYRWSFDFGAFNFTFSNRSKNIYTCLNGTWSQLNNLYTIAGNVTCYGSLIANVSVYEPASPPNDTELVRMYIQSATSPYAAIYTRTMSLGLSN